jgi:hypothetical protein
MINPLNTSTGQFAEICFFMIDFSTVRWDELHSPTTNVIRFVLFACLAGKTSIVDLGFSCIDS